MSAAAFEDRSPPAARPVTLKRPLRGLVCGKCVRRAGGDGGKAAKQLTRAIRDIEGGKAQARDVGCLKLCPKRRVLVLDDTGQAWLVPGETWLAEAAALLARPAPAAAPVAGAVERPAPELGEDFDPDAGSDGG